MMLTISRKHIQAKIIEEKCRLDVYSQDSNHSIHEALDYLTFASEQNSSTPITMVAHTVHVYSVILSSAAVLINCLRKKKRNYPLLALIIGNGLAHCWPSQSCERVQLPTD